jgi:hypothetical protein
MFLIIVLRQVHHSRPDEQGYKFLASWFRYLPESFQPLEGADIIRFEPLKCRCVPRLLRLLHLKLPYLTQDGFVTGSGRRSVVFCYIRSQSKEFFSVQ